MIDRRSLFFVVAAIACVVLIPLSDADLRWVPIVVAITYAVLAVLSYLDWSSRTR
jgi:hypothetical protein